MLNKAVTLCLFVVLFVSRLRLPGEFGSIYDIVQRITEENNMGKINLNEALAAAGPLLVDSREKEDWLDQVNSAFVFRGVCERQTAIAIRQTPNIQYVHISKHP